MALTVEGAGERIERVFTCSRSYTDDVVRHFEVNAAVRLAPGDISGKCVPVIYILNLKRVVSRAAAGPWIDIDCAGGGHVVRRVGSAVGGGGGDGGFAQALSSHYAISIDGGHRGIARCPCHALVLSVDGGDGCSQRQCLTYSQHTLRLRERHARHIDVCAEDYFATPAAHVVAAPATHLHRVCGSRSEVLEGVGAGYALCHGAVDIDVEGFGIACPCHFSGSATGRYCKVPGFLHSRARHRGEGDLREERLYCSTSAITIVILDGCVFDRNAIPRRSCITSCEHKFEANFQIIAAIFETIVKRDGHLAVGNINDSAGCHLLHVAPFEGGGIKGCCRGFCHIYIESGIAKILGSSACIERHVLNHSSLQAC